ncbi:C4-dicarboxylate ABC transporter substrate-binding protein [Fusobacterium ulcerans]|jgi:tripartite ATP-independent transporter DctP family solute receptor|uniref:TRAP-type mannitol/chloroaromatic compound transport system, periplasmic component n=1 Tax=Fusobacterium ulcerans TaxID=861 RepID=A0AAX1TSH5_9FUSO|nr:TRAP transporter substrate-binding protein [Fusobacterium ulcerans]AVQ28171.1 C4-dicarboxylate ABC transporter substrate-binding protein [Fusobacterium ulcerans]EFS25637.2 DctP family TRAP transporter solute receptor [Fusobacterium ulcerans ATCC 49185]MCB8563477.1 TRAP transporter substrate-binding protein [Fusobacterium ulcerans]MCB8647744.1 TRAP transporter substrate-binding protein [Fusobacterium ulcerans]RGY65442.1 TRAP transporter substrate-binding protein [Fusobacterium ulcerans]
MKRFLMVCMFIVLSTLGYAEKVMRVGLGVPESHFEYKGMELFKKNLEEKTNKEIRVELYPSNQIGVDQEVLEQIKFGAAHMNLPDPAVLGTFVKEFQFLSFPFIFDSQEKAMEVCNGEWGQELLKKLEKAGYVGLGFGPFGFRHVTNNAREIKSLEDFKGLKIRTMQNPLHLRVFRALGANPTPMPFSELFSALQQGVVDGQENPMMNIYSQKISEVQKYGTMTGHVYSWVVLVVGKNFHDSLTPEQQAIMQESADMAIAYMAESVAKDDETAREEMEKSGLVFVEPSDEFKTKIKEIVAPILEKEGDKINKDMYEKLKEATK